MTDLQALSDAELIDSLRELETRHRQTMAAIVVRLIEIEERRLHLRLGYSSLFDYCQRALGLSEDEAYRRMTVSRLARKWPTLVEGLSDGSLHMSGIVLLKPHLRADNCDELLEMARGASRRQLERRLAARFPQADSAESVRAQRVKPLSAERFALQLTIGEVTRQRLERALELMSHDNPSRSMEVVIDRALEGLVRELEHARRGKMKRTTGNRLTAGERRAVRESAEPGSPSRADAARRDTESNSRASATQVTALDSPGHAIQAKAADSRSNAVQAETADSRSNAIQAKAADSRSNAIQAKAADSRSNTEQTKASNVRAGAGQHATSASDVTPAVRKRAIARPIRREVFERDGEQCSFVGENGERCACRSDLELDHVWPWALGGASDPANLRVLCQAHNRWAAEEWFGKRHTEEVGACGG